MSTLILPKRNIRRERRRVRWHRFTRTIRGLFGMTPEPLVDPLIWLSSACNVVVYKESPCSNGIIVEISPIDDVVFKGISMLPMRYGPVEPWNIPSGMRYVDHCCWMYMLQHPDLLPQPH